MNRNSLRYSIIRFVVLVTACIFIVQLIFNLFLLNNAITTETKKTLKLQTEKEANVLLEDYKVVEQVCTNFSNDISSMPYINANLLPVILKSYINNNTLIVGGGVWLQPYVYNATQKDFGLYSYKKDSDITTTWDYNTLSGKEYSEYDWYKNGINSTSIPSWSEPYDDPFTKISMMTVSCAIKRDSKILGVVTMDVGVKQLEAFTKKISLGKTGYAFAATRDGHFMWYKDSQKKLINILCTDANNDSKKLSDAIKSSRDSNLLSLNIDRTGNYCIVVPIGITGIKLIAIVPKSEVGLHFKSFIFTGVTGLIITIIIFYLFLSSTITKKILNPLNILLEKSKTIGSGNFNEAIPNNLLRRRDEIGGLSVAIEVMQNDLNTYVGALKKHTTELDKRNSEIAMQSNEINALYEETAAMNDQLHDLLREIKDNYLETVSALANAIEAKDTYTKGHCERVTKYSVEIAKQLKLNGNQIETLQFAGLLHDIGKIGIPAEILGKPTRLTKEEFDVIKTHPDIGYKILKDVEFLEPSSKILLQHHEKLDGTGYPLGLTGDKIDYLAKILSVADAYDAMTSSRPYREAPLTPEEAVAELIKYKGTQFDAVVVDAFIEVLSQSSEN